MAESNTVLTPAQQPLEQYTIHCPRCGGQESYLRKNGPHIEAKCLKCDRHIKFVPKASVLKSSERFQRTLGTALSSSST